ncbi:2-hydroxyacid dehydrogenase [Baekduia soli]|nr:D-isomer specific 2-hydroxyacid dehydrogenase family protein [Baekduia soli]
MTPTTPASGTEAAPAARVAVVDCGPGDVERLRRLQDAVPTSTADGAAGGAEIVRRAAGAAVLVTLYTYTAVDAEVIAALPDLRLIITRTAGHSHIDAEAAAARGIAVATVPDAPTEAVAEFTLGALLALRRALPEAAASTRAGAWEFTGFRGRELGGSTLGVLGLGHIGAHVAQLGRAIGMEVLAFTRTPRGLPGVAEVALPELLERSSALSVNVPLTPQTRGLLGAGELGRLPRGAHVVNTSRGEVLDLDALCALLRSGHLAGACLDVLEGEPVAAQRLHALADVPNLLITPHISWHTEETLRRQFDGLVDRVLAFLSGRPIDTIAGTPTQGAPA